MFYEVEGTKGLPVSECVNRVCQARNSEMANCPRNRLHWTEAQILGTHRDNLKLNTSKTEVITFPFRFFPTS